MPEAGRQERSTTASVLSMQRSRSAKGSPVDNHGSLKRTMLRRRGNLHETQPPPEGWPILSLVALVGVTVAAEYLARKSDAGGVQPSPSRERSAVGAEEAGRGRHADTPSAIPVQGWKDIAFRVYENISKHRIMALAAGITYYTILAIFPALAALVAI